jgi:hypothetical protein
MNGADLAQRIRLYEGADMQPDPPMAHPVLMLAFLIITAWFAFGGMAYCIYRAVKALQQGEGRGAKDEPAIAGEAEARL